MSFVIKNDTLTFYTPEQNETEFIVPDNVRCIGNKAFFHCSKLKSVIIPDTVVCIGEKAFKGCSGLKNIVIPDGVWIIGRNAFEECTGLTDIIIPDSVKDIGEWAFDDCIQLKRVRLSENLKSIKGWTFENCYDLSDIRIPDSVTDIGEWAFSNCRNLRDIVIPDNVRKIGRSAFSGCNNFILNENNVTVSIPVCQDGGQNVFSSEVILHDFIVEKNANIREQLFTKNIVPDIKIPLSVFLTLAYDSEKAKSYMLKNTERVMEYLIHEDDAVNIPEILSFGCVTADMADRLIAYAIDKQKYEIQVILTNYKYEHFGMNYNPFDSFIL